MSSTANARQSAMSQSSAQPYLTQPATVQHSAGQPATATTPYPVQPFTTPNRQQKTASGQKMWRRRFLAPLLILQLICFGLVNVGSCLLLVGITEDRDPEASKEEKAAAVLVAGVLISLSGFSLLLTLIETGLALARKLYPAFYVGSGIAKNFIWFGLLVFIASIASKETKGYTRSIFAMLTPVLLTLLQVIYGIIVSRRNGRGLYNDAGAAKAAEANGQTPRPAQPQTV